MPTAPPTGELHGRGAELAVIADTLRRSAGGTGAVLILEGAAGMGKSRLLAEAIAIGRGLGARVGAGSAEPGDSVVELAALLSAVLGGPDPLLDRQAITPVRARPDQRYWFLSELQALLERAALKDPLIVCVDDAQWADSGTAAALRTLPAALTGLPITWIVALRPPREAPHVADAIEHLRGTGATTIAVGQLAGDAVAGIAADLLGAHPGATVLELVEEADGSPFVVVEMLLGLAEEDRVRVSGGRAELVGGRLPSRVRDDMRERLAALRTEAASAATMAASLGRTFSACELATALGVAPPALVAPIDELLAADLLAERGDRLAFWHDITREAVRDCVPVSVRRALDRHAAGVLLAAGALPVEVALQLASSAEPGDDVAVATLLEAARALVTTDPSVAARFGRRALEIAPRDHPRRGELVATTAVALHVAGHGGDAIAFADAALRQTLGTEQEAEVRLGIAGMFSIDTETRVVVGQTALALPGVSGVLRARHAAALVHNLATSGRMREARATLDEARALVEAARDPRAAFTLQAAESGLAYGEEDFTRGLELVTAAQARGARAGDDPRLQLVDMWLGEHLGVLDRQAEALDVAAAGLAAAREDRQGWGSQMFETFRARLLAREGRLSEARAILDGRFGAEDGTGAAGALEAAGVVTLGTVAIHAGDMAEQRRLRAVARVMLEHATLAVRRHAAWLLALLALADGDAAAARDWVRRPVADCERALLPRIPIDVTDEVALARIARAAGDDELAALALENARGRAALNPGVATIAATAEHVAGLLDDDAAQLERAVELFRAGPRPLALAGALEDLGLARWPADRDAGVAALGEALDLYAGAGAEWDARRVRHRLRELGVRRRAASAETPALGWEALTPSEASVARLVAHGLTNREVAERLFVSPNTVNGHLRHVFAKLAIGSRVELARLVPVHDPRT